MDDDVAVSTVLLLCAALACVAALGWAFCGRAWVGCGSGARLGGAQVRAIAEAASDWVLETDDGLAIDYLNPSARSGCAQVAGDPHHAGQPRLLRDILDEAHCSALNAWIEKAPPGAVLRRDVRLRHGGGRQASVVAISLAACGGARRMWVLFGRDPHAPETGIGPPVEASDGTSPAVQATDPRASLPGPWTSPEKRLPDIGAAPARGAWRGNGGEDRAEGAAVRPGLAIDKIATELRRAIVSIEPALALRFQPQVRVSDGRIMGVECLVRWQHPRLGALAPDYFVPMIEAGGEARRLTDWVVDAACRQAAIWWQAKLGTVVAVNVSGTEVDHPDFADRIRSALLRHGVSPRGLELELAETATIRNRDAARTELERLRALGVRIVMDDFGAGLTPLVDLGALPVDRIKIARLLTQGAGGCTTTRAMFGVAMMLAERLRLETVAVGVERLDDLDAVVAMRCDRVQGRLLYPELPAAACSDALRDSWGFPDATVAGRALRPAAD
ncbi:MAG: EAL domain-containing protein [Rhodocyclaceae bacterium]